MLNALKKDKNHLFLRGLRVFRVMRLGKVIEVPGFWDGGSDWKIRFTPPYSGTWKYKTFSASKGVNQKNGEIIVTGWSGEEKKSNPTHHGFVGVNSTEPRPGRYFSYSDGTPFLWIADTWWDWTNSQILLNL